MTSPPEKRSSALETSARKAMATCEKPQEGGPEADLRAATDAFVTTLPSNPLRAHIEEMKKEQLALRQKRKDLAKDVKNAKKRQSRLRKKARQMTDEDLVTVLLMRKDAKPGKEPGSGTATPASSSSSSSAAWQGAADTENAASEEPRERTEPDA